MREDLETLQNSDDEYVFGNYGTNGFITKEDIEEFNRVCQELIESFTLYNNENIKKINSTCSSCHGEGEYEVSAGSHSFFKECHCKTKNK